MPQEAIIGIVFVVASAAAILVADHTPRGGEAIKDILVGSLLWVTWPTIIRLAAVYAVIGVFHWVLRRRFLTISFHAGDSGGQGMEHQAVGFPVLSVVRGRDHLLGADRGVLLVFSFLVVPAAIAFQFTQRHGVLAVLAWIAGAPPRRRGCGSRSSSTCRPGR